MAASVLIIGNTYPVRDALRALGARWNAAAKGWDVPAAKADEARALLPASAPRAASPPRPAGTSAMRPEGLGGLCRACGDDCGGSLCSCGYGNG